MFRGGAPVTAITPPMRLKYYNGWPVAIGKQKLKSIFNALIGGIL